MKFVTLLTLSLLLQLFSSNFGQAQNYLELSGLSPTTRYKTFETAHFKFVYQDGYFDFTEKAATHLEHANSIMSPLLKWQPRNKTVILVADNADSANGFTMPVLDVGIVLIATPPDTYYSTQYADDWIKLLVFHEYAHELNIDPTTGFMEWLRVVFGDIIRPNGLWPVWMLEGLAVYFETRTSTLGRGRSPYYESILRAALIDGKLGDPKNFGFSLDRVNGDYPFFPGGEIPYLFGYHLWKSFAKERPDTDIGEYSIRSSHRVPYFIEGNLENITGKHWIDYWNSFVKDAKERLEPQLAKIKEKGQTPSEHLTHAGYSAQGAAFSPDGKYLAINQITPKKRQGIYLKELSTGKEKWISDTIGGLGMAFSKDSRYLIYSSLSNYKTYYTFSDIFVYDLAEDKTTQVTHGIRAKDPDLSPDGSHLVFIQSSKGSNLVRQASIQITDGKVKLFDFKTVDAQSPFAILGNPRFLNDQEVVYSSQELGKPFSDLKVSSIDGKSSRILYHDGSMNRFPYPDHGDVYFVSDSSGIENLYKINPVSPQAIQVTNVATGVIAPFAVKDPFIFASEMTSQGYELAKLTMAATAPQSEKVATPSAPQSITEALKSPPIQIPASEPYSPWDTLSPRQWSPFAYAMSGSTSGITVGGEVLGFDATGQHQYLGLGAYNFKSKTVDGLLSYTLYTFRPSITFSAYALTFDIGTDGSGTFYKREYETRVALDYPIFFTYSSLRPSIYGFMDWNGIYNLNTGQRSGSRDFEFGNSNVPGFGASLTYSDAETSKLGFMSEKGSTISVAAENRINTKHYSLWKYLASATHYFKVGDHSVFQPQIRYLGSSYPAASDRSYSLVYGKNTASITDRGTSLSLSSIGIRGYSDVSFAFRGAGVGSLNFHFPLSEIFEGIGDTLPVFVKQLHGFVFADGAYIQSHRFNNPFLPSYGGGLSLDTTLLIRAPIKFNFEIQNGTKKEFGGDSQLFFSVQSPSLF